MRYSLPLLVAAIASVTLPSVAQSAYDTSEISAREDVELFARTGGQGKPNPLIRPSSPSDGRRTGLHVTPRGPPYGIDVPAKPLVRPKPRPRAYEASEMSAREYDDLVARGPPYGIDVPAKPLVRPKPRPRAYEASEISAREYDDLVAREDIELFARTGGWEGKAKPLIRPSSPSDERRTGLYVTPRGPPYGIDVPAKPLVRPKPRPRAYEAVEISAREYDDLVARGPPYGIDVPAKPLVRPKPRPRAYEAVEISAREYNDLVARGPPYGIDVPAKPLVRPKPRPRAYEASEISARDYDDLFARTGGWEGKAEPLIRPSSPSDGRRTGLHVTPRGDPRNFFGGHHTPKPKPTPRPRAFDEVSEIAARTPPAW